MESMVIGVRDYYVFGDLEKFGKIYTKIYTKFTKITSKPNLISSVKGQVECQSA